MDLLCFPFQKSLKHLFRPRCVTEVCKNRFLSHTCVISFEECNQHCVQRANREEVGGVTWEAFLLECGGTARDKKTKQNCEFQEWVIFKTKSCINSYKWTVAAEKSSHGCASRLCNFGFSFPMMALSIVFISLLLCGIAVQHVS